ncbi:MAG: hypothetical protein HYS78_01615 [Parcubacteria group bacterium]|nr:hypothetical protein [Parcubacteria group bacterium]
MTETANVPPKLQIGGKGEVEPDRISEDEALTIAGFHDPQPWREKKAKRSGEKLKEQQGGNNE